MTLAQHGHQLDLGVSFGSLGLRVVLLGVVIAVAGYALLRPFLAEQLDVSPRWVTAAAGSGVLVAMLLSTGTSVPRQVVVLMLAAAAVPVYVAYRPSAPEVLRRAAPVMVALAGVGAAVLFARGLLDGAGPGAVPVLYDGLLLALVGLSWLVLCRPSARLTSVGGWLLATAAVAGAGHVAMLALGG